MAMTIAEKQRVIDMLDALEKDELERILVSFNNFVSWMKDTLHAIYCKIKDTIYNMWRSISDFFS